MWLLMGLLVGLGLASAQSVGLSTVAEKLDKPLFMTYAPDGSGRMFVLEQGGKVRILRNGKLLEGAFLDLAKQISCCGERGLLGLAFHPDYQRNGYFFVDYTDPKGNTVVARYTVSSEPNRADPASAQIVLTVDQPYANHNGGMLAFGPDGYLYIGLGDGGSGGDPQNHSQNLNSLLGKILRIDVNKSEGGKPYGIPRDNPWVNQPGVRPEIWSYGWRNPWRFSFDRQTGDLWVGDVGQNQWEEIDFQPAGQGGGNYGWRVMEGTHCYTPSSGCNKEGLILPVLEYGHNNQGGNSVTGGYRYRGQAIASLQGAYLYADFGSGRVWAATLKGGKWVSRELLKEPMNFSSFAEDSSGEVYLIDLGGFIYKLVEK